ncbi:MAG: hypothetical protein IE933_04480 [Sphingomonadales bacterium]|nr:hypothetical protein [Sphingomonadales bacterium]MBD3774453.1 hypothetical protein [Paracoccaceae bacterium]
MFSLSTVLSLLMLAIIVLLGGALLQWRRGDRRKAGLMVVLAVVAGLNIAIWTLPDSKGERPLDQAAGLEQRD